MRSRMKLSQKFLLVSIAAIVIIPLVVGIMLFARLKAQSLDSIGKSVERELGHLEFALGRFFEEVESDLKSLSLLPEVRNQNHDNFTSFLDADENTFEYRYSKAEKDIISLFNSFRITHPYVNSVYMGRENGSFVRSHPRTRPTQYDPRLRPWYIIAKENPGHILRTPPYESVTTPDVNLGMVSSLADSAGEIYGVIGIDVTLVNLTDYISECQVGRGGQIILTDTVGIIIASRDTSLLFQDLGVLIGDKRNVFLNSTKGFISYDFNGGNNFLFFHSSDKIGLKIGIIIPEKQLNMEIRTAVIPTMLQLFIVIGLVSVLLLIGLNQLVLRPLSKLSLGITTIHKTGNLDNRVDIRTKDELGELARSFNVMIEGLQKTRNSLKKSENELRDHKDKLEIIVEERTRELAASYDKLKRLEKLRDDLTSMVIHDMRTPLMGITSSIELLSEGGLSDEVRSELMEMLNMSSSELGLMVEALLDITRLEQEIMPVTLARRSLAEIITKAINTMRPIAAFEKVDIKFQDTALIVNADKNLTYRVMCNLLSNAIKFSPSGETVKIEAKREGNFAVIEVLDKGPGISEEFKEIIFEKYAQVEIRHAGQYRSIGLGLTFCRMAIKAQGGEITVHSEIGKGSLFRFSIPILNESENETSQIFL